MLFQEKVIVGESYYLMEAKELCSIIIINFHFHNSRVKEEEKELNRTMSRFFSITKQKKVNITKDESLVFRQFEVLC